MEENQQISVGEISYSIYQSVSENIDDYNIVESICDNVKQLNQEYTRQLRVQHKKHQEQLDEDKQKLDKMEKDTENTFIIFKRTLLLRQIMNALFQGMWNKYSDQLSNIDFKQLALKTQYMSRQNNVDRYNGVKFALAIIHQVDTKIKFSTQLCECYIKMNDKFHPTIKPISKTIVNIKELREIVRNNDYPICREICLSTNVLDHLIEEIEKHEDIFTF